MGGARAPRGLKPARSAGSTRGSPSAELAFPAEQILLGEAGEGAEVRAAEVGDLGGLPAVETVAAGEGFQDPGVDGEGLELAGAEEEHAVGDFFADAG